MEPTQPDPWIPDQPTAPLYTCVHCGEYPIEERICVECYNALIIALRADVTAGSRSDWISPRHNHREMLHNADFVEWLRDCGGHVPYSVYVDLIIKRAELHGF